MIRRWSAASIRVRLTAWYTGVLSLMLVIYAAVTFVAVRHEFLERLDDQLHEDFETAERSLVRAPDGRLTWTGDDHHHDGAYEDDQVRDVWSVRGEQIYQSSSAVGLPAAALISASSTPVYETVVANARTWRSLTGLTTIGGLAVVLRVARSHERLQAQLREILIVLALGLPVVAALSGLGGYVLARRALSPIDRLASEARRITADRLHERLSVPNQADEIGRLAAVINGVFARLEASFEKLRRFTADVSHELRTPLAVIRGTGEVGLAESRTGAEYREAMGSMLEEVDRLTNLVDTLLRLAHGDAGTVRLVREQIDLGQLASEVVASLSILADERHQRLTVDALDRVIVAVDRQVVREAITNVIDNAIKYAPAGTKVDVRVHATSNQAIVEVFDEGPGISPDDRERIFDRFVRLDEARSRDGGGTGLGLAIAKWAVAAHGGQIAVEPRSTGGSVFRILLPLTSQAEKA